MQQGEIFREQRVPKDGSIAVEVYFGSFYTSYNEQVGNYVDELFRSVPKTSWES
jgi:hypothetical protein